MFVVIAGHLRIDVDVAGTALLVTDHVAQHSAYFCSVLSGQGNLRHPSAFDIAAA